MNEFDNSIGGNENINYKIRERNLFLWFNRYNLLIFLVIFLFSFIFLFLPFIFSNLLLIGGIIFSSLNLISLMFSYYLYEELYFYVKFLISSPKKINEDYAFKNLLFYNKNNVVVFKTNKELIFKVYYKISSVNSKNLSDVEFGEMIENYKKIIKNTNILRLYNFQINFDTENNYNFIKKIYLSNKNEKISQKNLDFLKYQAVQFKELNNEEIRENKINVLEFSKTIKLINPKINPNSEKFIMYKEDVINEFENHQKYFNNKIFIEYLTSHELKQIKNKIFNFDNEIDIKVNYRALEKNNKLIKFIKINELPSYLPEGYLKEIFLNEELEASIEYFSLDAQVQDKIEKIVEKGFSTGTSFSFFKKNKRKQRAAAAQAERADIIFNNLIFDSKDGSASKSASMLLKLEAQNKKDLKIKIKKIKRFYKSSNIDFVLLSGNQYNAFLDFYFGYYPSFNDERKRGLFFKIFKEEKINNLNYGNLWLSQSGCAIGMPFLERSDIESDSFLLGRRESEFNSNPISIDFNQKRPNAHMMVVGQSGSGKSTSIEAIIRMKYLDKRMDPLIFIFDPKGEYELIGQELNAINLNIDKKFFNPFKEVNLNDTTRAGEFIERFLKYLFSNLNFVDIGIINIIQNLIFNDQNFLDKTFDFDNFLELLNKNKNHIPLSEDQFEKLKSIVFKYSKKGLNKGLFDSNFTIDKKANIVIFKMESLIGGSFSETSKITILTLIQYIANRMLENGTFTDKYERKIYLFIDELHLLVNDNESEILNFISQLYSISRSFNTSIISIFQNFNVLDNIKNKAYIKSMLDNTAYLVLFKLSNENIKRIENVLSDRTIFTNTEREFIERAKINRSLLLVQNKKYELKWDLGVFYEENRDEIKDNNKISRINKHKEILERIKDYEF